MPKNKRNSIEIISIGAEAKIIKNGDLIIKERIKKSYRNEFIDNYLRKFRTRREAKLLYEAKKAGVPVPFIIDLDDDRIVMSYIDGDRLRDIVDRLDKEKRTKIFEEIGRFVARLHLSGIVHGDLTTSNILIKDDKIFFIDFGLGDFTKDIEDIAVDLLLFKKCIRTSHYKYEEEILNAFFKGYCEEYKNCEEVIKRMNEIEKRGRYFKRGENN